MPLLYPLLLSSALFGIGLYGVLARRNAVMVLVGVELMLNAVTLQLVAYDAWFAEALHTGQVLALFVIALAAAEIGLGLAIVLAMFRTTGTIDVDTRVAQIGDAETARRTNLRHSGPGLRHSGDGEGR